MGTAFPVSIQDKEINALLDTGAEKSCMSMDMFARLRLSINTGRTPKLRNASGKDMKTHGVTTVKFKMGNIFTQEFVVCDDLLRPIIIRRGFRVSNYIGIIWTRQGTKKVTQDDRVVIEVEEPARGKTLLTMRKTAIPPRHYAEFELECDKLEGRFEIKPEPFLQQKEPNLWVDSFVIYNAPEDKGEININEEREPHKQTISKDNEERGDFRENNKQNKRWTNEQRDKKDTYSLLCFQSQLCEPYLYPKRESNCFCRERKGQRE